MRLRSSAAIVCLVACAPQANDTSDDFEIPDGAVDHRSDPPAPTWDDPVVFRSGTYVIPPYSEQQWCVYYTYEGPTVGIHAMTTYQGQFGHHFVMAGTGLGERQVSDGETLDCTDEDSEGMASFEPLLIGGTIANGDVVGYVELPEGMGARLQTGQRLAFQSHYVNTGPDPIVVQDETQLEVILEPDVTTWAAPFVHTDSQIQIPKGEYDVDVTCTWEDEYTVLFVGGHLHEWGAAYSIDHTRGESVDRFYEIPDWLPEYRDAPPYIEYDNGTFVVKPGDTFTTNCAWDNDTSDVLRFPQEMCATFGMVYPAKVPIICDPN